MTQMPTQHSTVLHCTVLYWTISYCSELHDNVLHCSVLYWLHCTCTVLYCIALHCSALFCTILLCGVSHSPPLLFTSAPWSRSIEAVAHLLLIAAQCSSVHPTCRQQTAHSTAQHTYMGKISISMWRLVTLVMWEELEEDLLRCADGKAHTDSNEPKAPK